MILEINNSLLEIIINTPYIVPPETGGIIGIKNGQVCKYQYDQGTYKGNSNQFRPNIKVISKAFKSWHRQGIDEYGILHTHAEGMISLSQGDREYITEFMSVNKNILKFYFPIVIPKQCMIVYCAVRQGTIIKIIDIKLIIQKEEILK